MSNTQTQKNDTETERQENLYKPIHIINPYQNCDCTNSKKEKTKTQTKQRKSPKKITKSKNIPKKEKNTKKQKWT